MSQAVNTPEQIPETTQTPICLSADQIIVSRHELHSLRFRVRVLKKFLNRLSSHLDAIAFQKKPASHA